MKYLAHAHQQFKRVGLLSCPKEMQTRENTSENDSVFTNEYMIPMA